MKVKERSVHCAERKKERRAHYPERKRNAYAKTTVHWGRSARVYCTDRKRGWRIGQ